MDTRRFSSSVMPNSPVENVLACFRFRAIVIRRPIGSTPLYHFIFYSFFFFLCSSLISHSFGCAFVVTGPVPLLFCSTRSTCVVGSACCSVFMIMDCSGVDPQVYVDCVCDGLACRVTVNYQDARELGF